MATNPPATAAEIRMISRRRAAGLLLRLVGDRRAGLVGVDLHQPEIEQPLELAAGLEPAEAELASQRVQVAAAVDRHEEPPRLGVDRHRVARELGGDSWPQIHG